MPGLLKNIAFQDVNKNTASVCVCVGGVHSETENDELHFAP